MRFLARIRAWEFRQLPAVHRCSRPTRPDKARRVGYKAKQGVLIYRVRVRRGDRKKRVAKGIVYGKPTNQGVKKWKTVRNLRSIAEERAGRKLSSLRELRGLTAAGRKARGLLKKGKRACKLRPSYKGHYKKTNKMRLRRWR